MEGYYERPREKLQARGPKLLDLAELVQLIIGAGSPKTPGALLARHITRLLEKGESRLEVLLAIRGVGLAKASQIVAAVELDRRLIDLPLKFKSGLGSAKDLRITELMSQHKVKLLMIWFFDANGKEVGQVSYSLKKRDASLTVAQKIAAESITLRAYSVKLAIGRKDYEARASPLDRAIYKRVKNSLSILSIRIEEAWIANASTYIEWSDI